MKKRFTGSPVSRYQVFTTSDGTFVVQWEPKYVQELLSGRYRVYNHKTDFGHPVSDYELKQLKAAGRVEHFNRRYVWLYALPERGRFKIKTLDKSSRVRTYYLSTTLSGNHLPQIQALLKQLELDQELLARNRNDFVVILGKNGAAFHSLSEAERAQNALQQRAPEAFKNLTVAFTETKNSTGRPSQIPLTEPSLDDLIASQEDISCTEGRQVILALTEQDEREALVELLEKLKMQAHFVKTGQAALYLLEDHRPDLLIMDVNLPDMHGWNVLGRMREFQGLRSLPVIALANEYRVVPVDNVQLVARPYSIAQIRYVIWSLLKSNSAKI